MSVRLRQLTEDEYNSTFLEPMRNRTHDAEEVVEVWPYAEQALRELYPHECNCALNVNHVYEAADGSYQHVLIGTNASNLYLVVVIDKRAKQIAGHYNLDLGALYALRGE